MRQLSDKMGVFDEDFVAPLDNFSLALDTMFGEVWKNYPDVAHFGKLKWIMQ